MNRYLWLDGIRGLAALYVLLHHAVTEVSPEHLHWSLIGATQWLRHGRSAVDIFIVLSGFSLMLPVVRQGTLRGGFRGYLVRRARRILPPYYAALALSLLLIAVSPLLRNPSGNLSWDLALPAFDESVLVSHLLLIHNYWPWWMLKIDPPMWSIAAEWQVYFLFPLFLFMWRRWGHAASIALAFAICFLVRLLTNQFSWPCLAPWYAGLFTFGMLAVPSTGAFEGKLPPRLRSPWPIVSAILIALCLSNDVLISDVVVGLAAAALLRYCASTRAKFDLDDRPLPVVVQFLESRFAVVPGAFSYSIYLVHYPLLALANNYMLSIYIGGNLRLAILILIVSPLVLLVSYLFHLIFERPFMPGHPRTLHATERVAAGSPAP